MRTVKQFKFCITLSPFLYLPCHSLRSQHQCQSKFFSVTRIAELLQSPQMCNKVTELCWGRTVERKNVLNVGRRRAETGMIGRQTAASSGGEMQRLEMCVDRRLWAGMMEQAVDVMTTRKFGDVQASRRHEQEVVPLNPAKESMGAL